MSNKEEKRHQEVITKENIEHRFRTIFEGIDLSETGDYVIGATTIEVRTGQCITAKAKAHGHLLAGTLLFWPREGRGADEVVQSYVLHGFDHELGKTMVSLKINDQEEVIKLTVRRDRGNWITQRILGPIEKSPEEFDNNTLLKIADSVSIR